MQSGKVMQRHKIMLSSKVMLRGQVKDGDGLKEISEVKQ